MALPCPNCGADLTFVEEYGRQYCYACGQYAPDGYGGGKGLNCPKCGSVLTYVKDYDRYYCYKDQEYAAEDLGKEAAPPAEAPKEEVPAPPPEEISEFDELLPPEPEPEPPAEAAAPAPEPPAPEPEPAPAPVEAKAPEEAPRVERPPIIEKVRPPLVAEEIARAKKAALMDLAGAYGLETMGTKDELKERLFRELHRREREEEARQKEEERRRAEEAAKAAPVVTPAIEAPAPSPPPSAVPEESAPMAGPAPAVPVEPVTPPAEAAAPTIQEAPPTPARVEAPRAEAVVIPAEPVPALAPEIPKVINPCPTCGRELTYVEQYDRYYCYHCKVYAPPVVKVVAVPAPPKVGRPCPTCGGELTYIPEYKRHYCYSCKKYAPARPRNPCPNCGKELQFIAQYQRHYCPACGQYAPKELTAQILAARSAAAAAAIAAPVARPAAAPAVRVVASHEHASPAAGVVLATIGLLLIVLFQVLITFPAMTAPTQPPPVAMEPWVAWLIQFLGLLLVGLGVIVGLVRIRSSK